MRSVAAKAASTFAQNSPRTSLVSSKDHLTNMRTPGARRANRGPVRRIRRGLRRTCHRRRTASQPRDSGDLSTIARRPRCKTAARDAASHRAQAAPSVAGTTLPNEPLPREPSCGQEHARAGARRGTPPHLTQDEALRVDEKPLKRVLPGRTARLGRGSLGYGRLGC